jgi:hypothetical protein
MPQASTMVVVIGTVGPGMSVQPQCITVTVVVRHVSVLYGHVTMSRAQIVVYVVEITVGERVRDPLVTEGAVMDGVLEAKMAESVFPFSGLPLEDVLVGVPPLLTRLVVELAGPPGTISQLTYGKSASLAAAALTYSVRSISSPW